MGGVGGVGGVEWGEWAAMTTLDLAQQSVSTGTPVAGGAAWCLAAPAAAAATLSRGGVALAC